MPHKIPNVSKPAYRTDFPKAFDMPTTVCFNDVHSISPKTLDKLSL